MPHAPLRALLARPEPARRLGPFVLVQQLGRGGFAPVWLAREVYGGVEIRRVAIKLFAVGDAGPAEGPEAELFRARVIEEAHLLCQVEHPNVVRFYRLLAEEEPGVLGLVMEHVDGPSLEQRLRKQGRLSIDDALSACAAVASALSAVHRAGLVHRDVKPANLVEANGVSKLIDFGIASRPRQGSGRASQAHPAAGPASADAGTAPASRSAGAGDDTATPEVDELPSGTVGYIDPVCVAEGEPATPASDLYALGATLFQCLTGALPSSAAAGPGGGLRGEVLDGRAPAPPLAELVPEAPRALCRLVDALLAPARGARPASAERVALELSQLRAERAGRARRVPPEDVGPFRGLGRFEEADRDVYFGRSAEVASALSLLRSRGLVALIGPSGSGKSSLARAGVAPAVIDGGLGGWIRAWDARVVVPGADPRASLAGALAGILPGAGELEPDAVVDALGRRAEVEGRGTLLVVDQLEELVTLGASDARGGRGWAAALLARIAEQATPGVRALVAARRDLLDPLLALPRLGRVLERGFLLVSPMSEVAWADGITQALEEYGYRFEDEALREELLADVARTATAMPLVQFALTELWRVRDQERKVIPRAGLQAMGGIAGALDRHAEATLARLTREWPQAEAAARAVLLSLTTPQGTRGVKTAAELSALAPAGLVAALEEARLLVREDGGLTLAHEALLTQWQRLRGWAEALREDRLLAEALERDAERWEQDRDDSLLWRKRRLAAAEDLVRLGLVRLSPAAAALVRRSRAAARRGRRIAGALSALSLLVLGGIMGFWIDRVKRAWDYADWQHELAQERAQHLAEAERQARQAREAQLAAEHRAEELAQARAALLLEVRRLKALAEPAKRGSPAAPGSASGPAGGP